MLWKMITILTLVLLTFSSAENTKQHAIYQQTQPYVFGQVYSWPTFVTRVGKQRPPHHEPDAFVFNTGAPSPGQGGGVPGGPGGFLPPGQGGGVPGGPGGFLPPGQGPNVFGFPGGPGRPFFPPVPGEGNGGRPGPRIPCCFGIGGGMPGGFVPGNAGIPGGMMPGNSGFPGGMPPNAGIPNGFAPGNGGMPGGFMPGNAGFIPGNAGVPNAFVPGEAPGNFMPRNIPSGIFPNAPGGIFPGNFAPEDPETAYMPEGATGFNPTNGAGIPGGIFPRREENGGREMYDDPTAGMFPIIQMAN